MAQSDKERLTARASKRMSRNPEFLGYLLALYTRAKNIDNAVLAHELNCAEDKVVQMSMCLRPGKGNRNFADDVDRIAARFSTDSDKLINIIRTAENLEAFQDVSAQGLLMAAREWDQEVEGKK